MAIDDDELYRIASGRAERDAGFLYADGTLNRWDQISRIQAAKEDKAAVKREESEEWWRRERPRHRPVEDDMFPGICALCNTSSDPLRHGRWAE